MRHAFVLFDFLADCLILASVQLKKSNLLECLNFRAAGGSNCNGQRPARLPKPLPFPSPRERRMATHTPWCNSPSSCCTHAPPFLCTRPPPRHRWLEVQQPALRAAAEARTFRATSVSNFTSHRSGWLPKPKLSPTECPGLEWRGGWRGGLAGGWEAGAQRAALGSGCAVKAAPRTPWPCLSSPSGCEGMRHGSPRRNLNSTGRGCEDRADDAQSRRKACAMGSSEARFEQPCEVVCCSQTVGRLVWWW